MAKYRSLMHISQVDRGDVVELPGAALKLPKGPSYQAYVEDVFREGATPQDKQGEVQELNVYPLLKREEAEKFFPESRNGFLEITTPRGTGLGSGYVLVPVPHLISNTLVNIQIRAEGVKRNFDHGRDFIQVAGGFDRSHPDMDGIMAVINSASHDDRPGWTPTGFKKPDYDRLQSEVGSKAKAESDAEREAATPRRTYTKRKLDAKKPGRKKQNVQPVSRNDLTLPETASLFSISLELRHVFNRLQARPETENLLLLDVVRLAEKEPEILKAKSAQSSDASIAAVTARGLAADGGYIESPTLLKFLNRFVEKKTFLAQNDPNADSDEAKLYARLNSFASLENYARTESDAFFHMDGIGPRNKTEVTGALKKTLETIEEQNFGGVDVDLDKITRELKTLRGAFQTEAMKLDDGLRAGNASEELKSRYQVPETKAPGQTPRYFHKKTSFNS